MLVSKCPGSADVTPGPLSNARRLAGQRRTRALAQIVVRAGVGGGRRLITLDRHLAGRCRAIAVADRPTEYVGPVPQSGHSRGRAVRRGDRSTTTDPTPSARP